MPAISHWQLRAAFARRLSAMYGTEVPAYNTLLEVSQSVNEQVIAAQGSAAERLGSIERVSAERHGAIRVGSPVELAQVARIFGAMGMFPVGFYDLRDASSSAVPVISTAFRPLDLDELAKNPFRVFTSMLTSADRRFFSGDLQQRVENFVRARELFSPRALELADRSREYGGLDEADSEAFLADAVSAFEISREPVDRAWYRELEAVSAVAADIAGVDSTHINHLTPRVLDIDALYDRMEARGIQMIDRIQGPPRWDGPDVLLRQTSFRALSEPRTFREQDGSIVEDSLRVRFGEVEARGIALTAAGRSLYDHAIVAADEAAKENPAARQELAAAVWAETFPDTERGLVDAGLGFFTYTVADRSAIAADGRADLSELLDRGVLNAEPIVYEDFLPRSAAGIFQSNLSDRGSKDDSVDGIAYDLAWLSDAIGQPIADPVAVYAAQSGDSLKAAAIELGLSISAPSTTKSESQV